MSASNRLKNLRDEMTRHGVDGYLIPRADEFLGEYVPKCAERLAWLTDFTGSAGMAIVLKDKAVTMTDGRYAIQVKQQVDSSCFKIADSTEVKTEDWIALNASSGSKIGYDPFLHTVDQITTLEKTLKAKGISLVLIRGNLIDKVWTNRPAPPTGQVILFPDSVAGQTSEQKRRKIAESIKAANANALIVAQPDSVAWLLNIRGADVPHTPLALSYAILYADDTLDWFIDGSKVGDAVCSHLGQGVRLHDMLHLESKIRELAFNGLTLHDSKRSSIWFKQVVEAAGGELKSIDDPCILNRACKSKSEQDAIIDTHIRDGVAVVKFLKWFDDESPKGQLDEIKVAERLESFRREDKGYKDSSFDTIAGWNENGAIVHYRAAPASAGKIQGNGMLLLDSGGQYEWGTTDITRTIAVGVPNEEMKRHFTLVAKGHIAVAMARFPAGTTGVQIDTLARNALWKEGLDYDHGTGHGVGCYLSVHEEAAGIHKRGNVLFQAGMLISNEPGYYREGQYGIRIESLVFVREGGKRVGTDKLMLAFETVTLAPIDRRLIAADMLEKSEKDWLNAYHARVYDTLSPRLEPDVKVWLKQATAEI
jgi:Xaa-Pro aminopeptidase